MKITLNTFEMADVERLVSWIDTPEVLHEWAGLMFSFPFTIDQARKYQATSADPLARRRIFKVVNSKTGDVVGHIELSHIWFHLSGRISRVLVGRPDDRGRGIGTAMVTMLASMAFSEFEFHRLDVGVTIGNAQAIACYERAGFGHVGTWADAMTTPTGVIDVYWMSLFAPTAVTRP